MKNLRAGWFWLGFLALEVTRQLFNTENSFINIVIQTVTIILLIIAIKKTFFKKKSLPDNQ